MLKKKLVISAYAISMMGMNTSCHAAPPNGFRDDLIEASISVSAYWLEFESVVPSNASAGWPIDYQVVAVKEPNSIYYHTGKYLYGIQKDWREDPQRQGLIISRNREYSFELLRRSFRVKETNDKNLFPASVADDFLWPVITWWPITRESNHLFSADPYTVLDVLESEEYQFRPELEIVEGIDCYVLESPHRSALWFDVKRIGVLVAREYYSENTGEPQWRIELRGHQEIKPGIWFPMKFRNIQYDSKAPTVADRKRKITDATFKVLDARLNEDVPDELFEIPKPKSGTIQTFEDGSSKQIVPGGYDHLDDLENWIERNAKFLKSQKTAPSVSVTEIACHVVVFMISLHIIYSNSKSSLKKFL